MKVVAANWKMNLTRSEGNVLVDDIKNGLNGEEETQIILGVPFPFLGEVSWRIKDVPNMHLAAQDCHQEENGAYTGEVSVMMLKSFGAEYVILGHSERREYFGEDDALILQKMRAAISHGLKPVYCCGEQKAQRDAGEHHAIVRQQLEQSVLQLHNLDSILIAYEPVWAIGTGDTATPEQAQDMHRLIRNVLAEKFGQEAADGVPLLYGGSVKPSNAAELFSQPDINGGLIGGASLVAEDFLAIVAA